MNKEEKEKLEEAKSKAREANNAMNNDRLAAIEAIADSAEERRVEEERPQETEQVTEPQRNEQTAKALQEEGGGGPEDTRTTNGETYYRQVVNGHELWQTLKEIRETAQKVSSADDYLRHASEGARKAAQLALSKPDEPTSLGKDEVRKLLAAQALGDEEAIEKLASLLTRPSTVSADVLQRIDQRLSFRTELAKLEEKSEDLLNDQYMGLLFRAKLNQLKAEQPTMGLSDAYTSIDKELRGAFPGFKGTRLQDKLERKRTLPQPVSTSVRSPAPVEEEGEENLSEVIEKMAKARGTTPKVHRSA
jgi:hypothetical protein